MDNIITESGMDFIADNTFHIECSTLYTDKMSSNGIRTVEFIRARGNNLIFVEAKTAFPKPDDAPNAEARGRFAISLNEVCEKFIHSLNLYSSVKVGVTEIQHPEGFSPPDRVTLTFVLVVKNHELEWCRSIEAALANVLPLYLRVIWKPIVRVINHSTAIKYNLAVLRDGNIDG